MTDSYLLTKSFCGAFDESYQSSHGPRILRPRVVFTDGNTGTHDGDNGNNNNNMMRDETATATYLCNIIMTAINIGFSSRYI